MDDSAPADRLPADAFTCPHCGHLVEVGRSDVAQLLACAQCGGAFIVPSVDGSTATPDPGEPPGTPPPVLDDELDGLRIRQLAKARRALIRTRSYLLIVVIACVVVGIQAAWNLIRYIAAGDWGYGTRTTGVLIAALVVIAAWAMKRTTVVYRELAGLAPPDPATPPDFSSLGDGSRHHQALDQMTQPPDERDD